MEITEKQKIEISEGKEFSAALFQMVQRVRDKSWQLIAFIIAVDSYLIKGVVDSPAANKFLIMSAVAAVFNIFLFKNLLPSLTPISLRMPGAEPHNMAKLREFKEEEIYYESLILGIRETINRNTEVLDRLNESYRTALKLTIWLLLSLLITVGLLMFLEALPC